MTACGDERRNGELLDETCANTGLHRASVIRRLGRRRLYGTEVAEALVPELLPALERHGEFRLRPRRHAALEPLVPAPTTGRYARHSRRGYRREALERRAP